MKRRSFLAGSVAAAASPAIGRSVRSQIPCAPARQSWVLRGPSDCYVIQLSGPAVLTDCFGQPDEAAVAAGEKPPDTTTGLLERAAMISEGSDRRPVSWRVSVWHRPRPLALRIALSGVEVPLEADLLFEIDAPTGLLSRNTIVRHRG
ncbi:MAG: hypothetical protein J2P48_22970, partial [Alphaproteobacteria bacterium]|nr:hypothetical protein [Alphaproteobacteria bacterium]